MRVEDGARLLLLAALWGGSFIFLRVIAPVLGAVLTAELRTLIAGLALLLYFRVIGLDLQWRRHWRPYLVTGVVNSALPFLFYAFAAIYLPASYSVTINSSSPLFGAVFSALWLGETFTLARVAGLALGSLGVALLSGAGEADVPGMFVPALGACLLGSACYGLAGVYVKRHAAETNPVAMAGASQLTAGAVLLPAIPFSPPSAPVTPFIIVNLLGLALLSSAVAYLLYFRLIANVGPTRTLTVTYLMPAFGILWSVVFLDESLATSMLGGCVLIVLGTMIVLRSGATR